MASVKSYAALSRLDRDRTSSEKDARQVLSETIACIDRNTKCHRMRENRVAHRVQPNRIPRPTWANLLPSVHTCSRQSSSASGTAYSFGVQENGKPHSQTTSALRQHELPKSLVGCRPESQPTHRAKKGQPTSCLPVDCPSAGQRQLVCFVGYLLFLPS